MKRRFFLKTVSVSTTGMMMDNNYWQTVQAAAAQDVNKPIPRRHFKEGVQLSIVGFGGIVVIGQDQAAANREVARAFERGVNYFDVAPSYGGGEAEKKLGIALHPYRKKSFLACKTMRRDAKGARQELENSLKVLKTDHFDLYQLHAMSEMEEVDTVLGSGGALEALMKARTDGKIRFVGFSVHSEEVASRLLDAFPFDSVLFPLNYVCVAQGNFGPRLLEKAKAKNVARLALKALAYTPWANRDHSSKCWYQPISDLAHARQAWRYTLSEDITAAIPPGDEKLYRIAESLSAQFTPLTPEEKEVLLASSKNIIPLFHN